MQFNFSAADYHVLNAIVLNYAMSCVYLGVMDSSYTVIITAIDPILSLILDLQ